VVMPAAGCGVAAQARGSGTSEWTIGERVEPVLVAAASRQQKRRRAGDDVPMPFLALLDASAGSFGGLSRPGRA